MMNFCILDILPLKEKQSAIYTIELMTQYPGHW